MKTQTISIAITVCLSLANVGSAQAYPGGWNPGTPTPEQAAISKHVDELDHAAVLAMNANRYAEAEADAQASLVLDQDLTGQELLASALYLQGKDKEALKEYKTVANTGTAQPSDMLPYALLLLKSCQYAQATDAYNKALPYVGDGDLLRASGPFSSDTSQSKDLETAIHVALGLTWTGSGLWDGNPNYIHALDEFSKALRVSPDNALANLYKGQVLVRLGYKAQARDAFARAIRLGGSDVRKAAEEGRAL